jgi:Intraflagellar transport complex B protein 46 C terminal
MIMQVPRPDKKDEDLGLKFLDEPSSSQSDPTVLELQLRAMSKKLQYGDVVVRSIDNASKNPIAIEKWIQSISDLHRSRPPPQVSSSKSQLDHVNHLVELLLYVNIPHLGFIYLITLFYLLIIHDRCEINCRLSLTFVGKGQKYCFNSLSYAIITLTLSFSINSPSLPTLFCHTPGPLQATHA